jgi:hypothetical protein
MVIVGIWTFDQLVSLQATLETQRAAIVQSIRTVSGAVHDTGSATTDVRQSIDRAQGAANQASVLSNNSAGTFRQVGANLTNLTVLGIQPLIGIGPEFDQTADQLQQLAISLGTTRDALGQNSSDVQRVGGDLGQLQTQLDGLSTSLSQPTVLGMGVKGLLPFQIAWFGFCCLVFLHAAMSIAGSMVLFGVSRAMRGGSLLAGDREVTAASSAPGSQHGPRFAA